MHTHDSKNTFRGSPWIEKEIMSEQSNDQAQMWKYCITSPLVIIYCYRVFLCTASRERKTWLMAECKPTNNYGKRSQLFMIDVSALLYCPIELEERLSASVATQIRILLPWDFFSFYEGMVGREHSSKNTIKLIILRSGPPSCATASTKRSCSSWVQRNRCFEARLGLLLRLFAPFVGSIVLPPQHSIWLYVTRMFLWTKLELGRLCLICKEESKDKHKLKR